MCPDWNAAILIWFHLLENKKKKEKEKRKEKSLPCVLIGMLLHPFPFGSIYLLFENYI